MVQTFNPELWIQMQEITLSYRLTVSTTCVTDQSGIYTETVSQKNCAKEATSEYEILKFSFLMLSFLETG